MREIIHHVVLPLLVVLCWNSRALRNIALKRAREIDVFELLDGTVVALAVSFVLYMTGK